MIDRLNLGGRAALAVPVIALAIGAVTALFSVALEADNALIKGRDLALITFIYATIIALPVGIVLSFPAVLFGHLLPEPRFGWLIAIGAAVSGLPTALLSDEAFLSGLLFAVVGAFAAFMWWHLVERHREPETVHD